MGQLSRTERGTKDYWTHFLWFVKCWGVRPWERPGRQGEAEIKEGKMTTWIEEIRSGEGWGKERLGRKLNEVGGMG